MTTGRTFVDTNILFYAFDAAAGLKSEIAAARLKALWNDGSGVLSLQVLHEFFANAVRKLPGKGSGWARDIVREYSTWLGSAADFGTTLRAMELVENRRLAFWDALIVAAAIDNGATTLLSEGLTHGQLIAGVRIENPFLAT
ncbi:MAG: PIN domain-containing protein [Rhodocyclaceae bacterium]